jgi:hypothetical protein
VVQEKGTGKAGGTGIIEKVVTTGRLSGQLRCCEQALENAGWDIQKNYDLNVRIKVGFSTEGGGKNWGDSPLLPLFEKNRGGDERKGLDEELTPPAPSLPRSLALSPPHPANSNLKLSNNIFFSDLCKLCTPYVQP